MQHSWHGRGCRWFRLRPAVAVAIRLVRAAMLLCVVFLPTLLKAQIRTIEHPGILHKDDNCFACHADKTKGKSVHSAMEIACTICHQAQTLGDMTLLRLELPKEAICFSCHEETMMLRQHPGAVKKLCLDCHDAHSSNRRMLLREPLNTSIGNPMLPSAARTVDRKVTSQP
jgi:predicted CXXCH cytochrome family protein